MKISLKINQKYEIPEIHVCGSENNAEIRKLYHTVKEAVEESLVAYQDKEAVSIRCGDVIRIFSANKMVYLETSDGQFRIKERLYEMEEKLETLQLRKQTMARQEERVMKKLEEMQATIQQAMGGVQG